MQSIGRSFEPIFKRNSGTKEIKNKSHENYVQKFVSCQ